MRNRSRLASLTLLVLLASAVAVPAAPAPAPAPAPADISRFINERTVMVADVDLTKLDAAAIEAFLMQLAKTAGITGGQELQTPEAQAKATLDVGVKWVNDVKQAGATRIQFLGSAVVLQGGNVGSDMFVVLPVADDKAPALAKLIPLPPPPPQGRGGRPLPQPQAQAVPGVGVVFGMQATINQIKAFKPAPRPDFEAALKAAGDAPIRLAIAPDEKLRQQMAKQMPPMILGKPSTLITKDLQWVSASATPPPAMTVKAVVQSTDAATAKATDELLVAAITVNQQTRDKLPDELIALLKPEVQGSQLVLSLDANALTELAAAMKEPLARSRQVALRVRSASNIRQLLLMGHMHAAENKGAWPADMKALEQAMAKYGNANAKQLMTNPARPDAQPAYVYIPPPPKAAAAAPAETVVMYESHKAFGDGVNVGFADGHVEFVADKQRFEQLLARRAQEEAAPQ